MKRTYGGWAVNSLRTTTRIELISDWIRTHHRKDRLRGNRKGRNWNRWHGSAAYTIDTSGKQPREHAVKFPGSCKVHPYRHVPRPSLADGTPHSCKSGTNRRQRGKR